MRRLLLAMIVVVFGAKSTFGATITIHPVRDNSIFEGPSGMLSNGSGAFLFSGLSGRGLRRALLAFDVAGSIPPGSIIDSASLTLHLSKTNRPGGIPAPAVLELRSVLEDWGEGTSNAGDPGGAGAPATSGDATWLHTFHNTSFWTTPGGDFAVVPSASQVASDTTFYTWGSTPQMVQDVQDWLDSPAGNHGWLLLGTESGDRTAKRFDSREHPIVAFRPRLEIEFTPGSIGVVSLTWTRVKALYRLP